MLFRVLAFLLIVVTLVPAIRRMISMLSAGRQAPGRPASAGHLVKDPVCGTYVLQEKALSAGNEFFCSEECRSKFRLKKA